MSKMIILLGFVIACLASLSFGKNILYVSETSDASLIWLYSLEEYNITAKINTNIRHTTYGFARIDAEHYLINTAGQRGYVLDVESKKITQIKNRNIKANQNIMAYIRKDKKLLSKNHSTFEDSVICDLLPYLKKGLGMELAFIIRSKECETIIAGVNYVGSSAVDHRGSILLKINKDGVEYREYETEYFVEAYRDIFEFPRFSPDNKKVGLFIKPIANICPKLKLYTIKDFEVISVIEKCHGYEWENNETIIYIEGERVKDKNSCWLSPGETIFRYDHRKKEKVKIVKIPHMFGFRLTGTKLVYFRCGKRSILKRSYNESYWASYDIVTKKEKRLLEYADDMTYCGKSWSVTY